MYWYVYVFKMWVVCGVECVCIYVWSVSVTGTDIEKQLF